MPGHRSAALHLFSQQCIEFGGDRLPLRREISRLVGIIGQIVQFKRRKGTVLHEFPGAMLIGFDGLATVLRTAFTPHEVVVAHEAGLRLAKQGRQDADAVDLIRRLDPCGIQRGGKKVHTHRAEAAGAGGFDLSGPARGERNAQAAFIHVSLATAPWAIVGTAGQQSAIVGGEHDQRVFGLAVDLQDIEHPTDAGIKVLDERDQFYAFLIHLRLALLHLFQPLGRRLHRVVRRVVGEVEKEWLRLLAAFRKIFAGPFGKQVRRMTLGRDDLAIVAHEVLAVAQVRPVVVHHVAEKTVKQIKAAIIWQIRSTDAEVPLADDGTVVVRLPQQHWKQNRLLCQMAPGVRRFFLAYHSRHADAIRVTARQQGCACRRADAAVRAEVLKRHPLAKQAVHIRRADVLGAEGAVIRAAKVVSEDDENVRLCFRECGADNQSKEDDAPHRVRASSRLPWSMA